MLVTDAWSILSLQRFLDSPRWNGHQAALGRPPCVLDLGCGDGSVAIELVRRGCQVTGIDISSEALARARSNMLRHRAPVQLLLQDARDLSRFSDGAFDLVIDNHVYHCIVGEEDRRTFLGEAYRVVRPGGLFFSESMVAEGAFDPARMQIDPVTLVDPERRLIWERSESLLRQLTGAGFAIEEMERRGQPAPAGDLVASICRKTT